MSPHIIGVSFRHSETETEYELLRCSCRMQPWGHLPGLNVRKGYFAMPQELCPGKDPGGWLLKFTTAPGAAPAPEDKFSLLSIRGDVAAYVARGVRNGLSVFLWLQSPAVFGDQVRAIDNRLAGLVSCKACGGTGNEFEGMSMFRDCPECQGTGGVKGTGIGRTGDTQ